VTLVLVLIVVFGMKGGRIGVRCDGRSVELLLIHGAGGDGGVGADLDQRCTDARVSRADGAGCLLLYGCLQTKEATRSSSKNPRPDQTTIRSLKDEPADYYADNCCI
jgi:hypothetical protein